MIAWHLLMIKALGFRLQTIGLLTKAPEMADFIYQTDQKYLVLKLEAAVFLFIEPQDAEFPVTFFCCMSARETESKE